MPLWAPKFPHHMGWVTAVILSLFSTYMDSIWTKSEVMRIVNLNFFLFSMICILFFLKLVFETIDSSCYRSALNQTKFPKDRSWRLGGAARDLRSLCLSTVVLPHGCCCASAQLSVQTHSAASFHKFVQAWLARIKNIRNTMVFYFYSSCSASINH